MLEDLKKLKNILSSRNNMSAVLNLERLIKIAEVPTVLVPGQYYTIKQSDILSKLVRGDYDWLELIRQANVGRGVDIDKLKPGDRIFIPNPPVRPNYNLNYSEWIVDLIKDDEGFRPNQYPDFGGGNNLIGFGHKIQPGEEGLVEVSESEAHDILIRDMDKVAGSLRRNVSTPLNQNQFDALVSIAYNTGVTEFYKSNVYSLIKSGNMDAAKRAILTFNTLGSEHIARRRSVESFLFGESVAR